jgi:uncharacterized LabA/DUF88 family protein
MEKFYGFVPPIQFDVLSSQLGGQRTYYYDAINYSNLKDESDEDRDKRIAAKQAFHDYVSSQQGVHVREGHVRRSPAKKKQEQKGVDVQLAVDALEHAARGNMEKAVLLTGDLDFEPLLNSLARMGVRTRLIYVSQHAPLELRQAADDVQKITLEHFWQWAAPPFQTNFRQVHMHYRHDRPEGQIFSVEREGTWNKRQVLVFKAVNQAQPRLWVPPGDALTEPSYLFEYPEIDKLPLAFELTFGKVEWK